MGKNLPCPKVVPRETKPAIITSRVLEGILYLQIKFNLRHSTVKEVIKDFNELPMFVRCNNDCWILTVFFSTSISSSYPKKVSLSEYFISWLAGVFAKSLKISFIALFCFIISVFLEKFNNFSSYNQVIFLQITK